MNVQALRRDSSQKIDSIVGDAPPESDCPGILPHSCNTLVIFSQCPCIPASLAARQTTERRVLLSHAQYIPKVRRQSCPRGTSHPRIVQKAPYHRLLESNRQ